MIDPSQYSKYVKDIAFYTKPESFIPNLLNLWK